MSAAPLGITRKRAGRGFAYYYESGNKITSERVLRRIKKLVIPPNWQAVQIARCPSADLQATGIDAKGRKQYLYHENWHRQRQQEKFNKLPAFGARLPEFRTQCWHWVEGSDWSLERSLALVCLLLDHTGLRAGNRQYTQQNQTYGLTTLRRKHFVEDDDTVRLTFVGKHNKARDVSIDDPRLAELVSECAEARGYALFRYTDSQGRWHDIDSDDVNSFIHEHMGEQYSCKDFRTWAASRYALFSLPSLEQQMANNRRRKWPATLTRHVAAMLGNTPSVCRQYYLHPKLYEGVESENKRGRLLQLVRNSITEDTLNDHTIAATEKLLAQVISSE